MTIPTSLPLSPTPHHCHFIYVFIKQYEITQDIPKVTVNET